MKKVRHWYQSVRAHVRLRTIAFVLIAGILAAAATPPVIPGWWAARHATIPNKPKDDYAPLNQGQLKNLVRAAAEELEERLPGGAGGTLAAKVASWTPPSATTDDYAAVNVGQLKAMAALVYDRCIEEGYVTQTRYQYPWDNSAFPPDDYAMANIGQAKNLFAFDLATRTFSAYRSPGGDGIAYQWKLQYGLNPNNPNLANEIAPGELTYLQKYDMGLDPSVEDSDGDGVSDGVEVQNGSDPKSAQSIPLRTIRWRTEWRELVSTFVTYTGHPEWTFGDLQIYAPNVDRYGNITAAIPFASVTARLEMEYPFADKPDDPNKYEIHSLDESFGVYGYAAAIVPDAAPGLQNYIATVEQRIFLETHPAATEPITRTMTKVTTRYVDGVASAPLVEPMTVTIPRGGTKSAPVDLTSIFTISPAATNHNEGVYVNLLTVEIKATSYGVDYGKTINREDKFLSGSYHGTPAKSSIDNLIAVWPGEWLQLAVTIQGNQLPITWTAQGFTIPNGSISHLFKWNEGDYGLKTIHIQVGGQSFTVKIEVPNVGPAREEIVAGQIGFESAGVIKKYSDLSRSYVDNNLGPDETPLKNAIRHSYWNALCASDHELPINDVIRQTTAHEYNNRYGLGTAFNAIGIPLQIDTPVMPAFDSAIDLHNNAVGRTVIHKVRPTIDHPDGFPDARAILADLYGKYANGILWSDYEGEGIIVKSNGRKIY